MTLKHARSDVMTDPEAIVAFIRARLAEERTCAAGAGQEPWSSPLPGVLAIGDFAGGILDHHYYGPGGGIAVAGPEDVDHIVRQRPAATLVRLDALTALVDRWEYLWREGSSWDTGVLRHVAAIYRVDPKTGRDHADWRPEWAA